MSDVVVDEDILTNSQPTLKVKILKKLIDGKSFQDLDRRLRLELVSIDGATIIDSNGVFLSVGAILRIAGGSTGGGRTAAAKKVAQLGLGIKISNDGYVVVYNRDGVAMIRFS